MDGEEHVVGARVMESGHFIAFKELEWIDKTGEMRNWESAERVDGTGAVLIIPRLLPSNRILIIRQFRPPARGHVYEFPAGMMHMGETPEQTANRELREETGYIASHFTVWPSAFTTPGLSSESVYMVEADIDEDTPENENPEPEFDETENIESIAVAWNELEDFYLRIRETGAVFDAKLAAYILARHAID